MTTTTPKKKIFTFLGITFAISAIYYVLIISAGTLAVYGGVLVLGLMWAPGIAGMATQLIYERTLRGLGWKFGKFKYLLLAFAIPPIYCLVVYGITWLTGLGSFPEPEMARLIQERWGGLTSSFFLQVAITITLTVLIGLIPALASALGEEIGWRGLFVPQLAKATGFGRAALISGGVWALWHFPILFLADYNMPGLPKWYAGLMFAVMVIGISFAFAWLRLKSGSLWPAAVLHASHNLFVQTIFTPLTGQTDITPFIIDEFGIGLALAGLVLAFLFWRKQHEVDAGFSTEAQLARLAGQV